jgi:hypothetical protein
MGKFLKDKAAFAFIEGAYALCNAVYTLATGAYTLAKAAYAFIFDKSFGGRVPRTGFEPAHLSAPPPEDGASTNFATWAVGFGFKVYSLRLTTLNLKL